MLSIDEELHPDGYNVGLTVGKTAGQTIVHVHLVSRYDNNVKNPTGGVRNVIPIKGNYVANKEIWEKG